jgi:hypothetical protein
MPKRTYKRRDSGLILPDDGIVAAREPLPWYVGKTFPDSRRWMSRRRCCCESCTIFSDYFSTDDLATEWTEVSGDWSIGSGVLSTSDSNAILTCNTTYPGGGFHNHVIQVSLKASTDNRSRIIFGYDAGAGTHNYVELYCIGSGSYVYIKKSDGTTIATKTSSTFTNGNTYVFKVCVSSSYASVMYNDTFVVGGYVNSSTTSVGVGTGTTSASLPFDAFLFSKHASELSGCPQCVDNCNQCTDGVAPERIQAVIDGVAEQGNCPNCNLYNGTWILKTIGNCCWENKTSGTVCTGTPGTTNPSVRLCLSGGVLTVYLGGTTDVTRDPMGTFYFSYEGTLDCTVLNYSTPWSVTNNYCNLSSATCAVTAL